MKYIHKAMIKAQAPLFGALIAGNIFVGRNRFPEPFDIMDHAGNMFATVPMAMISATTELDHIAEPTPHDRYRGFALGSAVAVLANVLVESKFGTSIFNALPLDHHNTPDMVDALYGAATGIATAAYIAKHHTGSDASVLA